jgi:hypothetical protein
MRTFNLGLEDHQQAVLIEWCELNRQKYPQLDSLYHIPNGKMRHPAIAAQLKAAGVKAGVPDLHLPFAAHGYHSLYIEMKRLVGGKLSKAQKEWRDRLTAQGNLVVTCEGWESAVKTLIEYLTPKTHT